MALTTIANVKAILNITVNTYDTLFTNALNATTIAIQNYLDKDIEAAEHITLIDAKDYKVILKHTPINYISYVGTGVEDAIKITYTGTSVANITILLDKIIVSDNFVNTTLTFATYPTIAQLEVAIEAITNFDSEVINGGSTKILYTGAISFAQDEVKYIQKVADTQDLMMLQDGLYATSTTRPHMIVYNGGFVTVPQDLVELVNQLIIQMYYVQTESAKTSGGIYQSESIGDYSYTLGQSSLTTLANTIIMGSPQFQNILEFYRNKVI